MGTEKDILLNEKLDRVIRILAVMTVKNMRQTEQIATLSGIGFSPKEIAEIIGTSANTVRVALVSIRKDPVWRKRKRAVVRSEEEMDEENK
jgi:DNA-binding NarL/FixJ family response regulator